MFLRVYLNVYYASDSVNCIICAHSLIVHLKTASTTASGIHKLSSRPTVRELAYSRVVQLLGLPLRFAVVTQPEKKGLFAAALVM